MNRSIAKRQILLKKYPLYFIKFYFRENVKEEIRENFRKHFRCSKIVASENDCESLDSLFDRPVTVAMINFITVYRARILLVHLDNPIPGSLRKMLNVILGGVSRYSFMVLSKCVHGAVLTLAIFSEMGQRLESSLHRCL